MKSNLETLAGLERKLTIEVPSESITQEFDTAYKDIRRDADIPGFRKGKAPIATIKKMYQDRVRQDVLQRLIQKAYAEALNDHDLEPVGYPDIKFDNFDEETTFEFSAQFEVRPEVKLTNYENLPVEKERLEVPEDKIDDVIENMRRARFETAPVLENRASENGDILEIDFEGFVDNTPFPGGSAQGHQLELGSGQFIPGFEEQLIGVKEGAAVDVKVEFPQEYGAPELAGKPALFKVTVNKLMKKVLPEVNDEFVASLGAEFKTVTELREQIRKDIEIGEKQRIEDDLKNRILKVLVDKNPMEVPQGLVQEQKQRLVENMRQRFAQQQLPADQFNEYAQKWDKDFTESAANMIRSSFLVDELATEWKIKAEATDIEQRLQEFAARSQVDLERVREYYEDPDRRSQLIYQITEDKVVQTLIDKADVTEVSPEKLADEKRS